MTLSPQQFRYPIGAILGATWVVVTGAATAGDGSERTKGPLAQASAPGSRDALFGDDPPKPASRDQLFGDDAKESKPSKPGARESLFDGEIPKAGAPAKDPTTVSALEERDSGTGLRGHFQTEFAYTTGNPDHWSKARTRLEIGQQGRLSASVKYKITGRFEYDAVFDIEPGFYPSEVKDDQRRDFQFRETYLDISADDWQFRLGRQHVIWGEVPGLFFADVVSAKDLREFVLPEFDSLRIPQWAARAEYFGSNSHLEFVWIPWVTVDRIGKPGADFYPFPPPPPANYRAVFSSEETPTRSLSNSNFGIRVSTLRDGWDLSAFAYRAIDGEANFYRQVVESPDQAFVFTPRHDRITQFGGTLSKDLRSFVLKAEAVYTRDKGFSVQRLSDPDGIVRLDIFDYLVGLDFGLGNDTRLYAYGFQRHFVEYDSDIVPDRTETGATIQVTHKLTNNLEVQALFITSLNRDEWMFRPRATWNFARNWRMNIGMDIMHGPPLGFFGRFADKDRVYADVRYSF